MTMPSISTSSTSRIGRKPINIPAGVDVKLQGQQISAKGPKGQLSLLLHPFVEINLEKNEITIHPKKNNVSITGSSSKLYRSIVGTVRANLNNLIQGVATGFEKKLVLVGVGNRAQAKGKELSLSLGYSHPTNYMIPEGITIETPTQTEIVIKGPSKIKVGQVAAEIRSIRPVEPYKGKGVRYFNEKVELKETKKK